MDERVVTATSLHESGPWTSSRVRDALTGRWPDDRHIHIYEAPLDSSRMGGAIDVAVLALWHSLRHEIEAVEIKVSYSDWCKEWRRVEWVFTDHTGRVRTSTRQWSQTMLDHHTGADRIVGDGAEQRRRYSTRNQVPPDFEPVVERIETVNTNKSIGWRAKCHRFWVAAPLVLANKIAADVRAKPELAGWGVLGVDEVGTHVLVKPTTNKAPAPLTQGQWLGLLRASADAGLNAIRRAEWRGEQRARAALGAKAS